ncbi:hypothetical protein [Listeria valentina]|uniref:hypothetical protein n=1 Tax=Listeria valentina TaxID=2705293 RepID=UPI00143208A5|nr:hypothetical protein [Listeria valentina]
MIRRFLNRFLEENSKKNESEQLERDIQLMKQRMRHVRDTIHLREQNSSKLR